MTLTINVPIFPMRKEIAARRRRNGLSIATLPLHEGAGAKRKNPRYSRDGLEFDVSDMPKAQEEPGTR